MKCVTTVETEEVNPFFSRDEKQRVEESGGIYDSVEILKYPAGREIDSPKAWIQCVIGRAVAADSECAKKVIAYLSTDKRKEMAATILTAREAAKTNQLGAKDKLMLERLERWYAVDLGLVPSPLTTTVTAPVKPAEPEVTDDAE